MAGNAQFSLYPCAINGTALRQIGSARIDNGINVDAVVPAGTIDPVAFIVRSAMPVIDVDTPDLTTLLSTISPTVGLLCSSSSDFYLQQHEQGGVYASGSSHVRWRYADGYAYLTGVSVSGEGPAIGSFRFYGLADGATDSESYASSVALGANTPTFVSQFYRGKVLNGAGNEIVGVQSYEIDFGFSVNIRTQGNDLYPSSCHIAARAPSIRVTFDNAAAFDYFTTISAGKSGGFTAYFMKGASGGTRAANGNHLSISASSGHWVAAGHSASGGSNSQHTMICNAIGTLSISTTATTP